MPFSEAAPILKAVPADLPPELKGKTVAQLQAIWPDWQLAQDATIRERLVRGEEDALADMLLFGSSFTEQPRATEADLASIAAGTPSKVLEARITDLLAGLTDPGRNERMLFARELLLDQGHSFASPEEIAEVRDYLIKNLQRAHTESERRTETLATARELAAVPGQGDSSRGLVVETSLLTNFGVERALAEMKQHGLLRPGSVRRVVVIGPGVDFSDRESGYDSYPQQTIQPFAVMDSLVRLELARADDLQLLTFDISPRVNAHIRRAVERANRDRPYIMQLPRDEKAGWTDAGVAYWRQFGYAIGEPATPVRLPDSAKDIKIRAVRFAPPVVKQIRPLNLNIVLQQVDVPAEADPFDLVIATNILDYYDVFQQNLALRNIAKLLRPRGYLICNTRLRQVDGAMFKLTGSTTTQYSSKPGRSDQDFWYERPH